MEAPVRPGDVLAGKYVVERVLGRGGMGVVVAARHRDLDEKVAIKFILPEYAHRGDIAARFLHEARACVKIKSEHAVGVSDVGRLDNGAPYMVMEFLEGCDLDQLLERRGPLPLDDALVYLLQACEALAEAHSLGIVHRDLKPPNLFLATRPDGSPCVKVLDFGISKFVGPAAVAAVAMTETGGSMGSPLYMSPEQLESAKHADHRTDIWALGVILFELLAGHAPFGGENIGQLVTSILNQPAPSLSLVRPDVPPSLDRIIARCLAKDRAERFPSIAALADELRALAPKRARISIDFIARVSRGSTATLPESSTDPPRPSAAPPPPRRPDVIIAAAQTDAPWGATRPEGGEKKRNRRVPLVFFVPIASLVLAGGGYMAFEFFGHPTAKPSRPVPAAIPEKTSIETGGGGVPTTEPAPSTSTLLVTSASAVGLPLASAPVVGTKWAAPSTKVKSPPMKASATPSTAAPTVATATPTISVALPPSPPPSAACTDAFCGGRE